MIRSSLLLQRFAGNPIMMPRGGFEWETKAVFNPAAIHESGRVHLLYRAIGETDTSVLGYASSSDGFHFDERLDTPAYVPREPWEGARPGTVTPGSHESPYMSGGGGAGGCEDPRLTRIGDRIYITYVAYSGYSHPRAALSSISLADFLARQWRWARPVLISPPGIIDKNICLLPEKIGGKYLFFHRVFPHILLDYVDSLDFDGTRFLVGQKMISPREGAWDSRKVGAGAPPIKTEDGWLLVYHAIGEADAGRYKIGAMLLDLKDPSRVIARTAEPLLAPDAAYENEGWKAGVAYPCGAVVLGRRLIVYYGSADMTVCAASVELAALLTHLKRRENMVKLSGPVLPKETAAQVFYGYCLKCRNRRKIKGGQTIVLRNGRLAVRGTCSRCGRKVVRIVKG